MYRVFAKAMPQTLQNMVDAFNALNSACKNLLLHASKAAEEVCIKLAGFSVKLTGRYE